jgi:hypothetical protein
VEGERPFDDLPPHRPKHRSLFCPSFKNGKESFVDINRMRFFRFKCRRPYEYLAQANKMIIHMEDEMQHLQVWTRKV